jgi:hypothetical protein
MLWIDLLAEQRIEQALREGAFDDLPGAGRPLDLDDDSTVPAELRAAYRILKNAGFVPPEVEARREVASVEALLSSLDATDDEGRHRALVRLALLRERLGDRGNALGGANRYYDRVLERLDGRGR